MFETKSYLLYKPFQLDKLLIFEQIALFTSSNFNKL